MRLRVFFTALLALLLLGGCGREQVSPVYEKNGWTVDTAAMTITKGTDVITYSLYRAGNGVTFTYPDGSTASWQTQGNTGTGTTSLDFDFDRWPGPMELMEVLDRDDQPRRNTGNPLGLLLIPLGVLEAVFPRPFWYLSHGWKYKNAQPSDLALGLGRAGGVLVAAVGLLLLVL